MKKVLQLFVSGICAGAAIAIGGLAFLITGSPWVFPIGLFIVCLLGFHLFTGKVAYAEPKHALPLLIIWIGNVIGAILLGLIVRYSYPSEIAFSARNLATSKIWNFWVVIPRGILCNVMIFIAVQCWATKKPIIQCAGLFFATAIFVLCKFEHCIANVFYFAASGTFNWKYVLYILVNTLTNAIGGIMAYRTTQFIKGE